MMGGEVDWLNYCTPCTIWSEMMATLVDRSIGYDNTTGESGWVVVRVDVSVYYDYNSKWSETREVLVDTSTYFRNSRVRSDPPVDRNCAEQSVLDSLGPISFGWSGHSGLLDQF